MHGNNHTNDAIFELTAFLVVSARGSLEEGVFTASYRLLDAIRRLMAALPQMTDDPFHRALGLELGKNFSTAYLKSESDYRAFLDGLLGAVGAEAKRRISNSSAEARDTNRDAEVPLPDVK